MKSALSLLFSILRILTRRDPAPLQTRHEFIRYTTLCCAMRLGLPTLNQILRNRGNLRRMEGPIRSICEGTCNGTVATVN